MRLLIDTNIVLELLLGQSQADDAKRLFENASHHEMIMSDYSVHSVGLLLFRRARHDAFAQFLTDVFERARLGMVFLPARDMHTVIDAARRFGLDFDDSYQLAIAEKYSLVIVSFDQDFDRTGLGRKIPSEVS